MVQREMEFSGLRDVDFPVSYQSRKGKTGRHHAALCGLGSWVGARVASPRCPILRPGLLGVPRSTSTVQIPPSRTWLAAGRWPSPVSAFVRPRLPRPDLPACRQGCKRGLYDFPGARIADHASLLAAETGHGATEF